MSDIDFRMIDDDHWYMNFKLPDEIISYLWNCVNEAEQNNIDRRCELAGNISRSLAMNDDKNIMVNEIFSGLYNSDLKKFFDRKIINSFSQVYPSSRPLENLHPILDSLWVNFQKKYEFNPLHNHSGIVSFVIWMKIPYDWENEKELPWVKGTNNERSVGNFVLVDRSLVGHTFYMNQDIEGHCVFFPSNFSHMVYPFYTSDEERISISGNIFFEL
jgi:hypothetical protein